MSMALDGRPIAVASKTLTEVEARYANIECKCLSVCFGLEKIHTYIYGWHITEHNDHKPLEMIKKKPSTLHHLTYKECYCAYRYMIIP